MGGLRRERRPLGSQSKITFNLVNALSIGASHDIGTALVQRLHLRADVQLLEGLLRHLLKLGHKGVLGALDASAKSPAVEHDLQQRTSSSGLVVGDDVPLPQTPERPSGHRMTSQMSPLPIPLPRLTLGLLL